MGKQLPPGQYLEIASFSRQKERGIGLRVITSGVRS